jgi:TRAP-type mannitol/chloroaromatic compound transport system permease small subunit
VERLARVADGLAGIAIAAGRVGAWACIPLIALIIVDVISRRFFGTGSTTLQELQWHLHALLFLSALGYAYIRNAHVRVDMVRENLSTRTQLLLEVGGFALILAPFYLIMIWYGAQLAWISFQQGEGSPNPGGLPHWWIIKSALPLGMLLVLIAGAAIAIRSVLVLYGPPALRERAAARMKADSEGARDDRRAR